MLATICHECLGSSPICSVIPFFTATDSHNQMLAADVPTTLAGVLRRIFDLRCREQILLEERQQHTATAPDEDDTEVALPATLRAAQNIFQLLGFIATSGFHIHTPHSSTLSPLHLLLSRFIPRRFCCTVSSAASQHVHHSDIHAHTFTHHRKVSTASTHRVRPPPHLHPLSAHPDPLHLHSHPCLLFYSSPAPPRLHGRERS